MTRPFALLAQTFGEGEVVTWLEGKTQRERRGVVEAVHTSPSWPSQDTVRPLCRDGSFASMSQSRHQSELNASDPGEQPLTCEELNVRIQDVQATLRRKDPMMAPADPPEDLRVRLEALLTIFRLREAELIHLYEQEPEPYIQASGDVYSVVIHELEQLL